MYGKCADCGKIVKLNKFLFGSLHACDRNYYLDGHVSAEGMEEAKRYHEKTGFGYGLVPPDFEKMRILKQS